MSLDSTTGEQPNSDVTATVSTKSAGEPELDSTPKSETDWPAWRLEELRRKYTDETDFGSWQDDYADSVGISRFGEL